MTEVDPDLLRRVTVFSTCTPAQLERLLATASVLEHPAGEAITEQGAIGHRFHLLIEGAAEAVRDGRSVGEVSPGEFVGEIGLLGGGVATATVTCSTDVRCLELRREDFWGVLEEEPAIALRILEVVCRRLSREVEADSTGNLGAG